MVITGSGSFQDGVIRRELYRLLKHEPDIHFTLATTRLSNIRQSSLGMSSSKFCLHIAGDTPSSNRLFDAISTHCVPVIISDEIELPFEDVLDYSEFCVFVRFEEAVKKGYVVNLLRSIGREEWSEMWERLKRVSGYFEYGFPSRSGDAVDMIWQAVYRKRRGMRGLGGVNKRNRYRRRGGGV